MNGKDLVKIIDAELEKRNVSQKDFCAAIGIGSSAMSAWRNGSMPKPERIKAIEEYLGISLSEYPSLNDETMQLREMLREREDLRILLKSARDVPASSVYSLIAQLEKMKEDAR